MTTTATETADFEIDLGAGVPEQQVASTPVVVPAASPSSPNGTSSTNGAKRPGQATSSPPKTQTAVHTGPVAGGPLPEFEKVPVGKTEIKLSGAIAVNTRGEITVGIDDRIRVVGEFRVVRVNFIAEKNGQVVRQHVLAPVDDLDIVPWDPMNPNDIGILRAHP